MTDITKQAAADGTLDDHALDQVAGGNDGLGLLAGALIGGVVGGIAEAVVPHHPNVVFAAPGTQFVQQPTYVQAAPPVVYAPQQYVPQQYAPQQYAQPYGQVANSGW